MKKIITLLSISMFLTACSVQDFYQVYQTSPTNGKIDSDKIVFQDTNAQISYNLWDDGGNAGFKFFNKSTKDITIHLDKSFFVLNGIAYDYFKYRTYTQTSNLTSITTSRRYPYSYYNTSVGGAISSSNTTSYLEPNIIIVPPNTAKQISEYMVTSSFLNSCDLLQYPTKNKIKLQKFDQNNSPFVFSNLITYSIQGDTNRLENNFYVTSVSNMHESEVFDTKYEVICGKETNRLVKVAKNSTPTSFYFQYD